MQSRNVPTLGPRYWVAISVASVFGANLGDFASHDLHLGHWRGLLPLAVLLLGVLATERRMKGATEASYWAAIVIIRTAATNLGDLGTHDFHLGYGGVALVLAVLLGALTLREPKQAGGAGLPKTDSRYWIAMLVAGTLGTVVGDGWAAALAQGIGPATLVSSAALAVALWLRARTAPTAPIFYWITIVLVRTAGTNMGDLGAHCLGLVTSSVVTGVALIVLLVAWRERRVAVLSEA